MGTVSPAISDNDTLQVRDAVFEILNNDGRIVPHFPARFRPAVQDLAEARDDRTNRRKERYQRAVSNLLPLLNFGSPRLPGSPHIQRLLAQWELACSQGPALLPTPQSHEKFEYTYVAQGGETITEVSRRFGYDNPGPLCHPAYDYSPYMRLRGGDKVYVPFPPRLLKYWIAASTKLADKALEQLKEDIETVRAANEQIESFLMGIRPRAGAGLRHGQSPRCGRGHILRAARVALHDQRTGLESKAETRDALKGNPTSLLQSRFF
jgi:hypothetical protein